MNANILILDIETAPKLAHVWGMWNQNLSLDKIESDWFMLCWASKWAGDDVVHTSALPYYKTQYAVDKTNDYFIVKEMWDYLDRADIVVAHNAVRFDVAKIQAKFLEHKLPPVSPFKIVDTLKVAKKEFALTSNKLEYIAKLLDVTQKKSNKGFELWKECMEGDEAAWEEMIDYNVGDIHTLEDVYMELRPWIRNHPNVNLYHEDDMKIKQCPVCGASNLHKRGTYKTQVGLYQRYKCVNGCGAWSRERTMVDGYTKAQRKNVLSNAYQ